jgi:hypothetical protein
MSTTTEIPLVSKESNKGEVPDETLVTDDVVLVDDSMQNGLLNAYSLGAIHKKLPKLMPIYTHCQQRQRWGDTQLHPHTNWGDVFFDLFYVAGYVCIVWNVA